MPKDLTNETISKICMMMRIIDVFHKNIGKMEKLPDLKKEYNRLNSEVNEIMRELTDEQRNKVLEIHKNQMKKLNSNP